MNATRLLLLGALLATGFFIGAILLQHDHLVATPSQAAHAAALSNRKTSQNRAGTENQDSSPPPPPALCNTSEYIAHTEFDGSVIKDGGRAVAGGLVFASAVECCEACTRHRGCNVLVWNSDSGGGASWLKHTPDPRNPGRRGQGSGVECHGRPVRS